MIKHTKYQVTYPDNGFVQIKYGCSYRDYQICKSLQSIISVIKDKGKKMTSFDKDVLLPFYQSELKGMFGDIDLNYQLLPDFVLLKWKETGLINPRFNGDKYHDVIVEKLK